MSTNVEPLRRWLLMAGVLLLATLNRKGRNDYAEYQWRVNP
jgi:hypothetical protein